MWTAYDPTVIGTDPNAGYAYIATQIAITNSTFNYEISPDLQNQNSVFSQAQCGNATYISWANLIAQTNRREWNSGTQSHWAFYATSMNANNQALADTAGTEGQQLPMGTLVQPYPVNYSETGKFLGQVN